MLDLQCCCTLNRSIRLNYSWDDHRKWLTVYQDWEQWGSASICQPENGSQILRFSSRLNKQWQTEVEFGDNTWWYSDQLTVFVLYDNIFILCMLMYVLASWVLVKGIRSVPSWTLMPLASECLSRYRWRALAWLFLFSLLLVALIIN